MKENEKPHCLSVLRVNYDEGKTNSYESLEISFGDNLKKFENGCFIKDLRDFYSWLPEGVSTVYSSSYDHFLMDTEIYIEKHFKTLPDDSNEFLSEEEINSLEYCDLIETPSIIALREHKSFGEWKKYLKDCQ